MDTNSFIFSPVLLALSFFEGCLNFINLDILISPIFCALNVVQVGRE